MIAFPPCKINLGLNVTARRSDGYHHIESLFYPVQLNDVLEVVENPENPPGHLSLTLSGLPVPGESKENLVVKAFQLINADFPLPGIRVHLHKAIPMGAGLGGGSSDGAYMVRLLNQKFNLGISKEKMTSYAEQLGSDCPFFIQNDPALASGRGDVLRVIPSFLNSYHLCLIYPGIHVSTPEAFGMIQPKEPLNQIEAIVSGPIESWKNLLLNDFEAPVSSRHPEIAQISRKLYDTGAIYASMTGSGSTVYGIFRKEVPKMQWPEHYFSFQAVLQ
jgi:4-diphosphocytidyl-2-C-methyl-D-erythritol kinase